jgi:hypothetical protein
MVRPRPVHQAAELPEPAAEFGTVLRALGLESTA